MATVKSTKDLNHHARADEDEANTHFPKLFLSASDGQMLWKEETSNLEWLQMPVLPAVINFVEGSDAPPTEVIGNIYVLINSAPHADWDGAAQNDWVRFTGTTWSAITPVDGVNCHDKTLDLLWHYDGSDWVRTGAGILETKKTIVTADVLQLNSAPIEIVASPGVGKAIELISWATSLTFVSAPYDTNTNLVLITDTATDGQGRDLSILLSTGSRIIKSVLIISSGATFTQIIENKALQVTVETGNPASGDSDIIIYITYRIINL